MISRITTLNPKFCLAVVVLSFIGLINEIMYNKAAYLSFWLGGAAALLLMIKVWDTMKANWPIYKRFYSMTIDNSDASVIAKSWGLTWWIIPYTVNVFGLLDLLVLFRPEFGTPLSLFYGAAFATFAYSMLQGPKYYLDALSAQKAVKKKPSRK